MKIVMVLLDPRQVMRDQAIRWIHLRKEILTRKGEYWRTSILREELRMVESIWLDARHRWRLERSKRS